jgi:hypothetical protein
MIGDTTVVGQIYIEQVQVSNTRQKKRFSALWCDWKLISKNHGH